MTNEEARAVRERIAQLTLSGSEGELRSYIAEQFPRLPQDMKDEILGAMLAQALQDEADEIVTITQVQEESLAASEQLQQLRANVEQESDDAS